MRSSIIALLIVAFTAATASADRIRYLALDRIDETNAATVDVGLLSFSDQTQSARRVDVSAHVAASNGFGAYVDLPIVFLTLQDTKDTTLANAQLGTYYARRRGAWTGVGRVGVFLPTAGSDFNGIINNSVNAHARIADLPAMFPDTTWGRLSASVEYRQGQIFGRFDLGVDAPLATPELTDHDALYRFGFGGGVRSESVAFSIELMNVRFGNSPFDPAGTHHSLAAGLHFPSDSLTVSIAAITPVDENVASQVRGIFLAGVRVPLP